MELGPLRRQPCSGQFHTFHQPQAHHSLEESLRDGCCDSLLRIPSGGHRLITHDRATSICACAARPSPGRRVSLSRRATESARLRGVAHDTAQQKATTKRESHEGHLSIRVRTHALRDGEAPHASAMWGFVAGAGPSYFLLLTKLSRLITGVVGLTGASTRGVRLGITYLYSPIGT